MAIIKELKKTIRFFIPYGIYRKFDEHRGFLKEIIYKTCKFYRNKTENFGVNLMDKNEECVVLASGPSLKKTFAISLLKIKKNFKCIHFGGYERKMLMGQYATYVNYNFLDKSEKIQKILLNLKSLEKSKKFKMYKYGVVAILLWELIQILYSKLF